MEWVLLQCMKVKRESEVAQSCPTPSGPTDCSPPGYSVQGIFQARVMEWGAIAFSDDKPRLSFGGTRTSPRAPLGPPDWTRSYKRAECGSGVLWGPGGAWGWLCPLGPHDPGWGGVGPVTCVQPCNPTIAWLRVAAQSGATSEGSLTATHSVASPGPAGNSRSRQQDVSPQAR